MTRLLPDENWSPVRHYTRFAVLVLAVAAFNLTFRLHREMIDVWDESLFATSAFEMPGPGGWVATTFQGQVDYFNSKPPLNTWLIAWSFKLFGVGLVPLRLASVVCAWLTIFALMRWSRTVFGAAVSLLSGLVLGTSYAFLYVHSGRTANADGPLALVVTLAFIALWMAQSRPWHAAWLGPLAAAAFMLKGPGALAFLAPLCVADVVLALRTRAQTPGWLAPRLLALATFAAPVAAWSVARWQFDEWRLLGRLFSYDLVARGTSGVEGHAEPFAYYVDVLLRHSYDWLVVGAIAAVVAVASRERRRTVLFGGARPPGGAALLAMWGVATLVVPTVVTTKLAWYLNPFYPVFALGVAVAIHAAWRVTRPTRPRAAAALAALVVLATLVAEGRMAWRSYRQQDLGRSAQELLLVHASTLRGARVFARRCPYPEAFLARVAGARCVPVESIDAFLRDGTSGDAWIGDPAETVPALTRVGGNRRASLHVKP